MQHHRPSLLALAVAGAFPFIAHAADTALQEVVVTAPAMEAPLTVTTDPHAPRQPIPAQDGADILKNIPGFSVIRKGGTDGDPVFRGMSASRLNILLDGEQILGGCGNRMDPPTAYVFPEIYDRITVLKGPQTVLYGPGNSAGTVLFERSMERLAKPGTRGQASVTFGSYGRNDQLLEAETSNGLMYAQVIANHSHSQDYRDGNGKAVHSFYDRWSTNGAIGWTPDQDTRLELSFARSDGHAAYGDRGMDGAKFARENVGLKFEKARISPLLAKLEAQVYYNYVDHVMDNVSLRNPGMMMPMLGNPDRKTEGGRVAATLDLGDATQLVLGSDLQSNEHTSRSGLNYQDLPRLPDMRFLTWGVFGELTRHLADDKRVIGGLRLDRSHAEDQRSGRSTSGQTDDDTLKSGFLRYEQDYGAHTFYAGVGHTERAPDYWERSKGVAPDSSFQIKPEKTSQIDLGVIRQSGKLRTSVSVFYNKIRDYILIQKLSPSAAAALNVDATTFGGEADASYALTDTWKLTGALSYVRGEDDTRNTPLAQMPPLEARFGLNYDDKVWSAGALWRLVSGQHRIDKNFGNIVGQDIGETGGFGVFSLNGGWRPKKGVLFAAGVDNLFDKTYAEFISKNGSAVSGYDPATTRVNEPGRTFWLRASIALE